MLRYFTYAKAHDIAICVVANFSGNIILVQICCKSVVIWRNKRSTQVAIHCTCDIVCKLNSRALITALG